jgi:prepilin-type processing-associated H-X9-DG protein
MFAGNTWNVYWSGRRSGGFLSKETSPASTVVVFECSAIQHPGGGYGQDLQDFTNANEGDSPSGAGAPGQWGSAVNLASPYNGGIYATGPIGGYTDLALTLDGVGRHSGGANYLLADSHVKWALPSSVSGGYPAATPTTPEHHDATPGNLDDYAAGTQSLTQQNGSTVAMTFSPT